MSTALTTIENTAQAIAAAAQEEGASGTGVLAKFSKGHFFIGTEEVPLGTEFIAHVQHWVRGWVKFRDGSLIEHRVGRVADRFVVPAREDLDETDQTEWATGPKGPEDPWTQQSYLPLENVETGDIVTFVSGSVGGRSAVSKLCARAAKHLAAIGQPRIKLAVESYSWRPI
jgi:hypothetical protein